MAGRSPSKAEPPADDAEGWRDGARSCIGRLINDPVIAERVRSRIGARRMRPVETGEPVLAPCAARRLAEVPGISRLAGFLRDADGALLPCALLGCLCGQAPESLTKDEVSLGRSLLGLAR